MSLWYVSLAVGLLIAGFTELLVFNEEVLLALCFIGFIFFAFSYLNVTVSDMFQDRVAKFESDLLLTFQSKHIVIDTLGRESVLLKYLNVGFNTAELIVSKNYLSYTLVRESRLMTGLFKEIQMHLTAATSWERDISAISRRTSLQVVVYPLVFSLGKDYMFLIKSETLGKTID